MGKIKILNQVLLCICIQFLLLSCVPYTHPVTSTATEITAPTTNFTQSTITGTNQSTLEATPKLESTSSSTPTLLPDQARAKVLELLETNNGCKLPCFWGVVPGNTKWSEVRESLRSISSQYSDDPEETNIEFFYSDLYLPANDIQGPWDLKLELGVYRDIIRTISVSDFDLPNYHLRSFLLENGKPDEIWIYTNSRGPSNSPDKVGFLVSLFYSEKQMIAAYGRGNAVISDTWIDGCIQYSPALKIWSLEKLLSFPEAASFFYNHNVVGDGWKEISEATNGRLNVEKFYQTFTDQSAKPCFKTPRNLWLEN